MPHIPSLTFGRILLFWLPLAATWLMMAVEGPFLSAVIARLADPTPNLASYGVAFSLALLVEAPIIMVMSATTALVRDKASLAVMRRFVYGLCAALTLIMLLVSIKPVFSFLALRVIQLPPEVTGLSYLACLALIPWPAAIGYRRFYQGVLIRNDKTRFVAYGTVVRLASMSSCALFLAQATAWPGAVVGGAALASGVVAEAAAIRCMAARVIADLAADQQVGLTLNKIAVFYFPLALTTILALGIRPLVTFFLGQSRMAVESLAVFPVLHSLVFIFISMSISYQEVIIALIGDRHENYPPLRNFAILLALAAGGGLSLVAFTPLCMDWYHAVSGLSLDLSRFALTPTRIMTLVPALWVVVCMQRGVLVCAGRTAAITRSTLAQVGTVVLVLLVTIHVLDLAGITASALALVLGGLAGCTYLIPHFRSVRRMVSAGGAPGL